MSKVSRNKENRGEEISIFPFDRSSTRVCYNEERKGSVEMVRQKEMDRY